MVITLNNKPMEESNMLKDYTIAIRTKEGVVHKSIQGYQTSRAALNVVVGEMNTNSGVICDSGTLFIPVSRIIDIEVTDVRG